MVFLMVCPQPQTQRAGQEISAVSTKWHCPANAPSPPSHEPPCSCICQDFLFSWIITWPSHPSCSIDWGFSMFWWKMKIEDVPSPCPLDLFPANPAKRKGVAFSNPWALAHLCRNILGSSASRMLWPLANLQPKWRGKIMAWSTKSSARGLAPLHDRQTLAKRLLCAGLLLEYLVLGRSKTNNNNSLTSVRFSAVKHLTPKKSYLR